MFTYKINYVKTAPVKYRWQVDSYYKGVEWMTEYAGKTKRECIDFIEEIAE